MPGQEAVSPSSSSMRSNWLYLATLSVREGAPVLIWPAPVATARSAMKVSSVSPERWELQLVPRSLCGFNGSQGLGDCANLVELN